jgi:hypothetical protein
VHERDAGAMRARLATSRLRARRGVENHTAATAAAAMRRWRMRLWTAGCLNVIGLCSGTLIVRE